MIFLDTSIIIAYYLPEPFSKQAQAYFERDRRLAISSLVSLEMVSVLSRLVRTGNISRADAQHITDVFSFHQGSGLYERIELGSTHFRQASTWIARFDLPLRAPDALHLAAAWHADATLITADRQLARNAEQLGVACELLNV